VTLEDVFETLEGDTKLEKDDFLNFFGFQANYIIDDLFGYTMLSSGVTSIPISYVLSFLENGSINQNMREHFQAGMDVFGVYSQVWRVLNVCPGECSSALSRPKLLALSKKHTHNEATHSMWKKHETNIQERIVKHLTFDENGSIHELIETDRSQNEVIHIESKIVDIFAHREYTQQEQTEEIDKEVATFIRATEEFIHLKNEDDEYEYVHSEIPNSS
jgi:hypothetical protein